MILWISISIFIILSVLLFIMDIVQSRGEQKLVLEKSIPKDIKVILVLSADIKYNGEICDILEDRLKKAINLSEKIKDSKFLLSGECDELRYDKVEDMKRYIINQTDNIKEEDILLDKASFSTYESIYRAKNIFDVSEMIIISNYYHLPRALYVAEKLGITAFGVFSDSREYMDIEIYRQREILALVKDFVYINILKPKILKDNSSNKKVTRDKTKKL